MVYAKRGVGKTHFALGVAYAVAAGAKFLSWQAETPRKVLYIDGEMPGEEDDPPGGGCCDTSRDGARGNLLAFGLVALVLRRRRRARA